MISFMFPSGTTFMGDSSNGYFLFGQSVDWEDFAWAYDAPATCETFGYNFTAGGVFTETGTGIDGTDQC